MENIINEFASKSFLVSFLSSGTKKAFYLKVSLFFIFFYAIIFLLNFYDDSLVLEEVEGKDALGYLEDYANYFYFISFFLALIIYRKMIIKFSGIFFPENSSCHDEEKIVKNNFLDAVNFDQSYVIEYGSYVEGWKRRIALKDPKYKIGFYSIYFCMVIIFVITSVYLPIYTNQVTGNWNFSFSIYPVAFISNQIKDFIIWILIAPHLLFDLFMITLASIKICKKIERDRRFNIKPLSPDNAGGLSELGGLTLLFSIWLSCNFFIYLQQV